ncbi:hypothetical protein [Rhodopseudomonas sp. RCAM05734]|uniref:hypothetical protein n=1 Tax=Rhodopseudomonas sp. RCAM05734 TaxID=3457549 RepID=UPI004043A22A
MFHEAPHFPELRELAADRRAVLDQDLQSLIAFLGSGDHLGDRVSAASPNIEYGFSGAVKGSSASTLFFNLNM